MSYAYNSGGGLSIIDYSDTTPDATHTHDGHGRQSTIACSGMTTTPDEPAEVQGFMESCGKLFDLALSSG